VPCFVVVARAVRGRYRRHAAILTADHDGAVTVVVATPAFRLGTEIGHHSCMGDVLALVIGGLVAAALILVPPAGATYNANSYSEAAWRSIGRSKRRWVMTFWILPFLVGPFAATFYLARIRRELAPFGKLPRITRNTRVSIVRGTEPGRMGLASPGRGPFRLVSGLTNTVWLRLDTGELVGVGRELVEPVLET
jgi:hypothetical protein